MRYLLLGTVFIGTAAAAADTPPIPIGDEIIVTAARVPMALKTVGSAVDVLTADDIDARPRFEVSDLLREIPGIAVNRSGGMGSLTQIRMRGSEADQTVVMIDGVEVGDPFNNSEFDFANLMTAGIDRIEILRGPQSALYGAQAIGGVINILTTQGSGPPKFVAEAQGGSFGTYAVNGTVSGGGSGYGYGATAAWLDTAGVSQSRIQPELDGHHNLTLNATGHVDLSDIFSVNGTARYMDAFVDLDTQDFNVGSPTYGLVIDSDTTQTTRTFSGRTGAKLQLLDGAWTQQVNAALTSVRTRTYDSNVLSFGSNGTKLDLDYQSDATLGHGDGPLTHAVTAAVQFRDEHYDALEGTPGPENQSRHIDTWSLIGEYRLAIANQVFLSGSLRRDINQLFADDTTYRATAAWAIPSSPVKLRASISTGEAKPTFYDLYGFDPTEFIGNPKLQPEKSQGWDTGADITLGTRGLFSLTYFHANLRDEIITDFSVFPFTTENQPGIAHRDGVETALRYSPSQHFSLAASYTYSKSTDDTGVQEVRRPRNIASVSATGKMLNDRLTLGASVDYNGKMTDVVFVPSIPSGVTTLHAYTLVTVNAAYDLTQQVQIFSRVENLLNTDYQEVYSYNHLGRSVYGGVRVKFGG